MGSGAVMKELGPRERGGELEAEMEESFGVLTQAPHRIPQSLQAGWSGSGRGHAGGPLPGAVGWRLSGGAWRRGRVSPSAPLK